jgi:hypothetical protein
MICDYFEFTAVFTGNSTGPGITTRFALYQMVDHVPGNGDRLPGGDGQPHRGHTRTIGAAISRGAVISLASGVSYSHVGAVPWQLQSLRFNFVGIYCMAGNRTWLYRLPQSQKQCI